MKYLSDIVKRYNMQQELNKLIWHHALANKKLVLDFNNYYKKYYIRYNIQMGVFTVTHTIRTIIPGVPYFDSKEGAELAIELIAKPYVKTNSKTMKGITLNES